MPLVGQLVTRAVSNWRHYLCCIGRLDVTVSVAPAPAPPLPAVVLEGVVLSAVEPFVTESPMGDKISVVLAGLTPISVNRLLPIGNNSDVSAASLGMSTVVDITSASRWE